MGTQQTQHNSEQSPSSEQMRAEAQEMINNVVCKSVRLRLVERYEAHVRRGVGGIPNERWWFENAIKCIQDELNELPKVDEFSKTVNAIYEKGALQLDGAIELPEGTKLQLTIVRAAEKGVLDATDQKIIAEILTEDAEVFQALAK